MSEFTRVDSSMIRSFYYEISKEYLIVIFSNHVKYGYDCVPHDVYKKVLNSKSVGKAFLKHIKDKYDYKKL